MNEPLEGKNRRRHVRKPASFEIEVRHLNNGFIETVGLRDFSEAGMSFHVADINLYSLKQQLDVSIPEFMGSELLSRKMRATVVWLEKNDSLNPPASVGVSLTDIPK